MTAFQLAESAHAPLHRTMGVFAEPVPVTAAACSVPAVAARAERAWPAVASSPARARTAAVMIRRVPTGREASLTDIVVPFRYDVRGLVQEAEQRPVDLVNVGPGDGSGLCDAPRRSGATARSLRACRRRWPTAR